MRGLVERFVPLQHDGQSVSRGLRAFAAFAVACAAASALFGCASSDSASESNQSASSVATVIEKTPSFELYSLPSPEAGQLSYQLFVASEIPFILQVAFDGETHAILFDQDGNTVADDNGYPVDVVINPDDARESGAYSVSCGTLREGLYTVSLSGGENAGIRFLAQRFCDVPVDAWYFTEGDLDYAVDHGILRTLTNAGFGPCNTVLRADVVDALYNIAHAGDPAALDYDKNAAPFDDMPLSTKSAAKLAWAADVGIARAEPSNIFRAEDAAAREEAAVLIARYAEFAGADMGVQTDAVLSDFVDANAVSEDARKALAWCIDRGVIRASGAYVSPRSHLSFGEASQVFTVLGRDVLNGTSL